MPVFVHAYLWLRTIVLVGVATSADSKNVLEVYSFFDGYTLFPPSPDGRSSEHPACCVRCCPPLPPAHYAHPLQKKRAVSATTLPTTCPLLASFLHECSGLTLLRLHVLVIEEYILLLHGQS